MAYIGITSAKLACVVKNNTNRIKNRHERRRPLQLGFVPMTDCAPLVVAKELGIFEQFGLKVELNREVGWATVREKIYHGELDASQAPGSMVFELSRGYNGMSCDCITALVTALNGNAITLSNELWELGVRDGDSLREVIQRHPSRRFTFAGVLKYSSQNYLMRHWLLSHGIDPDKDVDMAIVAPPQVHDCLKHGYLDGYCVAEPWSSISLLEGVGWCATLTADFQQRHLEKVFLVTKAFHDEDPERHISLLLALREAARYCDDPANRQELVAILSKDEYVGLPPKILANALVGPFVMGKNRLCPSEEAIIFYGAEANRPSAEKARWVLDEIGLNHLEPDRGEVEGPDISTYFREDIFEAVLKAEQSAFTN
ncbi:MAG: nitrate ABC transporter ATP-binding protein [Puniceicoccaceae bacterium]|nr:MAG: nitrate ABC transporter ATP-binding protein [Puniceicoccaceae bacterium]